MNEALLLALPAGFFVGATLNIPVGPNGALAFFRASIYGWKSILPTALGALLASSIYIFVGALFVSNPTVSAISKSPIFHGLGGVLLMLLAVFLYKSLSPLVRLKVIQRLCHLIKACFLARF